ncbi:MAG: AzlD domain-containing protein [Bacillota bacterium]
MKETALLIFLMTAVTYLPRVIPAVILSRRRLPRAVTLWLSYVPVAVMAAILAPALFVPAGELDLSLQANPAFWVSIPVFALALRTRNLFITVIVGMVLIALLRMAI